MRLYFICTFHADVLERDTLFFGPAEKLASELKERLWTLMNAWLPLYHLFTVFVRKTCNVTYFADQ